MAGSRKFAMPYISRDDVAALTPEAAAITGLPYVMDLDREEVDGALGPEKSRRAGGWRNRTGVGSFGPGTGAGVAEWQTRGT
jgi:hypothetical protein